MTRAEPIRIGVTGGVVLELRYHPEFHGDAAGLLIVEYGRTGDPPEKTVDKFIWPPERSQWFAILMEHVRWLLARRVHPTILAVSQEWYAHLERDTSVGELLARRGASSQANVEIAWLVARAGALPRQLHADTGRPGLFQVQQDWYCDRGDDAGRLLIDRLRELWERPAEEWELGREVGRTFDAAVRLSLARLQSALDSDWIQVGSARVNLGALRRAHSRGSWTDIVRAFGREGIDAAYVEGRNELELRPTRERFQVSERETDQRIIDYAIRMIAPAQAGMRAADMARLQSQAFGELRRLEPGMRTPTQLAHQLALWMMHPRLEDFSRLAADERVNLRSRIYDRAAVLHVPPFPFGGDVV